MPIIGGVAFEIAPDANNLTKFETCVKKARVAESQADRQTSFIPVPGAFLMQTPIAPLRIAALVFAAVTFVVVGDTAGKLLTQAGVAPAIVAWSRFALAALMLLPFSGLSVSEAPKLLHWRVLLRGGCITGGIYCILTALRTEPIANVYGAFFIGPIVAYLLAVLFLGERPSRSRSLLLSIGFAGVLLVVKPGAAMSVGALFALGAGCFYGAYLTMTRRIAGAFRPRFLLISQLLIGSVALTPLALSTPPPMFDNQIIGLLILSASGSAIGNYILVLASKQAEASVIAPLIYTQLLSATLAGVIVFKTWPDAYALIGLTLIAFSGFASLAAERDRAQKA